jgi:elongation factor 1-gamma
LIDQWLDTIRMDLMPAQKFIYTAFGFPESFLSYDLKNVQRDIHEFIKTLKVVDQKLNSKQFLVGDKLSIADITLVSDLATVYRFFFTAKERNQLPSLTQYFDNLVKLPALRSVLGIISPIEKAIQPIIAKSVVPPKPQVKSEPKKEAPKAKPQEEEEDGVVEEKAKVYLFPETKFDFFAFKTMYVNAVNKQEALDYLWANWDDKAFSFWYLKYDKLPSECQKQFLTNNLMNGFIDRADNCRKYCLGVHGVYGDEPNLEIRGVWMWKGLELLEPLKEHSQFDVYFYSKLDVTKPEDKALITEYWTKMIEESDQVEGRTARTIKFFK